MPANLLRNLLRAALVSFAFLTGLASAGAQTVPVPAAIVREGVPEIPAVEADVVRPYGEFRTAAFLGWHETTGAVLIATRFGATPQLHLVARPEGARRQITFQGEPILSGGFAPKLGDVLVFSQDRGGDEFLQFYRLAQDDERPTLITDGKSRNTALVWSGDGALIAYSTTRRNGADTDIHVMDPRKPETDRRVFQMTGGGWRVTDWSANKAFVLIEQRLSANESNLFLGDVATGKTTLLVGQAKDRRAARIANTDARFMAGSVVFLTDRFDEFVRLARVNPATGEISRLSTDQKWDVEEFDVDPEGARIAYVLNEAGVSRLRLLDVGTGATQTADSVPDGVISGVRFGPMDQVAFSLTSARIPGDVFTVAIQGLGLERWTRSETGGLQPINFALPQLVAVNSFDGLEVSGFLYRPDPQVFPGKRPLIIDIHGGPEAQVRPTFRGRMNYLVNQLGIAVFYPNVRGSTGYGKSFLAADNGFKRMDSVKDIGAFLAALRADAAIDANRIAVTGGSYGGFMTLAAMIEYGDQLRAGLEAVGITHFVTFLENTQAYRRDLRRVEYGDERDPKMRKFLDSISPLTNAKRIKLPLMVVTGANDPRVPASEADQIIAAVRANGGEAWHVLAKNEAMASSAKKMSTICS
jgi:dipeptidyl aminopeptidase/acylaminoacyl peptidase